MPRIPLAKLQTDDDTDTGRPTVLRTAAGATPITKPVGVMNSAFDVPGQPAKRTAGRAPGTQNLDLAAIVIHKGRPLPPAVPGKTAVYPALWARMQPGDSVELPYRNATSLAQYARKAGGKPAVRKLTETTTGVWREA